MESFSKQFKNKKFTAGFTLVEMVTVIGIFVVVTGIILANLPAYRNESTLDIVAQEVATQVRGAQVYAMSTVAGSNITAGNIFGYILQVPASGKDFKLCSCKTANNYTACNNACTDNTNVVEKYQLSGKIRFAGAASNLYFKRPMGNLLCSGACPTTSVIQITDGVGSRYIKVGISGNIAVSKTATP